MFRKITITNFKSLAMTTTELGPFTVLVGNNGAGKSSFLQAIELASWAVKYDSINEALMSYHIDFRDLAYLRSGRKTISFEAELEMLGSNLADQLPERVDVKMLFAKKRYVYIKGELVEPLGWKGGPWPYQIMSSKRERSAMEGPDNRILHQNVALGHSMLRDVYLSERASQRFPVLYQVASHFMGYIHYEIWGPEDLRTPSRPSGAQRLNGMGGSRLGKRGEDLPALLWNIREREEHWEKLLVELRHAYPGIQGIQFKRGLETGELGLMFVERPASSSSSLSYRPSQMSDGFLRLLALLAIKHQPTPLALLGYEEPENGLHPSALDDCMRHLKGIAEKGTQVIITTHSPYLLNHLLEDETPPKAELRLVMRDDKGQTTIAPPDPGKIERARRQGFGVGELWGMLLDERELASS